MRIHSGDQRGISAFVKPAALHAFYSLGRLHVVDADAAMVGNDGNLVSINHSCLLVGFLKRAAKLRRLRRDQAVPAVRLACRRRSTPAPPAPGQTLALRYLRRS